MHSVIGNRIIVNIRKAAGNHAGSSSTFLFGELSSDIQFAMGNTSLTLISAGGVGGESVSTTRDDGQDS